MNQKDALDHNRLEWVDFAKAIGIILVVYGHIARGLHNAGIYIPESLYRITDAVIYSFHMPLFFFLSGLFFYKSFEKSGSSKLILNKIDTILYPYVIWSILQGSIEVGLSQYTNAHTSLNEVFSLLWMPRAQFWFLYALFSVFCILSVQASALKLFQFSTKTICSLLFIFSLLIFSFKTQLPDFPALNYAAVYTIYFTVGILFAECFGLEVLFDKHCLLLLASTSILSQFIFSDLELRAENIAALLSLASLLFVVSISFYLAKTKSKTIALIGASSMGIYLMHTLISAGVRIFLQKILGIHSFGIHLTIAFALSILLPILALKCIQKYQLKYLFSAPISHFFLKLFKSLKT